MEVERKGEEDEGMVGGCRGFIWDSYRPMKEAQRSGGFGDAIGQSTTLNKPWEMKEQLGLKSPHPSWTRRI